MDTRSSGVLGALVTVLTLSSAIAEDAVPAVYTRVTDLDPATTLANLNGALRANGFSAIQRMDTDQGVGLVFTQPEFAERIGSADPSMAAAFPLHLTVVASGTGTRVHFPRPMALNPTPAAAAATSNLEQVVVQSVESAITPSY